jgi:hypothetical protein
MKTTLGLCGMAGACLAMLLLGVGQVIPDRGTIDKPQKVERGWFIEYEHEWPADGEPIGRESATFGTGFECLVLGPGKDLRWLVGVVETSVKRYSIVDSGFAQLGERSLAAFCLDDPPTLRITFEPGAIGIQVTLAGINTGAPWGECWSRPEDIGIPGRGMDFGPRNPETLIYTVGLGFSSGIAGCEFYGVLVDNVWTTGD